MSLAMTSSGPFALDSPFVIGNTISLSASSSSSTPMDPWVNDYFDVPLYLDDSRPSTGGAGPSSGSSNWWENQDTFCRNKQKLFVSFRIIWSYHPVSRGSAVQSGWISSSPIVTSARSMFMWAASRRQWLFPRPNVRIPPYWTPSI